jgi:hypothetical protein
VNISQTQRHFVTHLVGAISVRIRDFREQVALTDNTGELLSFVTWRCTVNVKMLICDQACVAEILLFQGDIGKVGLSSRKIRLES